MRHIQECRDRITKRAADDGDARVQRARDRQHEYDEKLARHVQRAHEEGVPGNSQGGGPGLVRNSSSASGVGHTDTMLEGRGERSSPGGLPRPATTAPGVGHTDTSLVDVGRDRPSADDPFHHRHHGCEGGVRLDHPDCDTSHEISMPMTPSDD